MHRLIFLLFILSSINVSVFSQHVKKETWYDAEKRILKESFYVLKKNQEIWDSLYVSFYQNGKPKSQGYYYKNKPNGIWEYFYENGKLKMKGELKDNVLVGIWEYFYENGGINMKGNIDKGMRENDWVFYFENGNKKSEGKYQKNMKEGLWKYFYEDGSFKAKAEFQKDKGKYVEVFPNGNLKSEGEISSGKSNGLWKYYYENGGLKAEGEERNGVKEGSWKYYYDNGKIASEGNYLKGKETGKWKYYHENGNLSAEGDTKDGQKDGFWKLYYSNGAFKAEGHFKEGDGIYKEYYESGKLKIEGNVKKGKNEGEWKYYYENGLLEGKCFFTNGKGHYAGYYENGNLKMEGMIEDGNKVGIWNLYNENGEIAGYYKTYYENEVPVFIPLDATNKHSLSDSTKPVIKPIAKLPKKRSRHYTGKVNEYKGFILGAQPLGMIRNSFPVSLEYYFQERLGLEVNYTIYRNPFFRGAASLPINALYKRGFSTYLRHKLYNKDQDNGMLYWAQEIRFSSIDHYVNTEDSAGKSLWHINEKIYEFSILYGDRLLRDPKRKGWTIDVFGGLGLGYRALSKNYQKDPKKDALFLGLKTRSITIPIRIGFTIGYLF